MMRIKSFKSFSRFAVVLMVLCTIPSGAFASENNPKYGPAWNITEENFTDVQADLLESISEQIAELQSFYSNVSEASNASDLQEILSSRRPANECMGPHGMNMEPGEMHMGPGGMHGVFGLDMVENVTDENFTDVQTEIVASLGNMTEMLEAKQTDLTDAGEEDMAEELGAKITALQNLSTEISEASTASELQEVVLTYMKTEAVELLEKQIESLEAKVSESENTSDENMSDQLNSRITELTALEEEINGVGSLTELRELMFSSQEMPGMGPGDHPMKYGGHGNGRHGDGRHGGCNCLFDCPGEIQGGSTDNNIDDSTDNSTE
jgi:hypothetical protein